MPSKSVPPLTCIWGDCSTICCTYEDFRKHHENHLNKLWVLMGVDCGICGAPLGQDEYALRHVHFHTWATLLRTLGKTQQQKNGWPDCDLEESTNAIPEFPTPFSCGWRNCSFQTNDVYTLYTHVLWHPEEYEGDDAAKYCQWENCDHVCIRKQNLQAHLRCHTQEKLIACPKCGFMFTSVAHLRDHLMRQISSETLEADVSSEKLRCPYCEQVFATKSLMNAHISRHINNHKCPLCSLTLRTKSAVKRHILFRHVDKPNVQCPQCPSLFKDIHCLRSHISRRHSISQNSSQFTPEPELPLGPLAASGNTHFSSAILSQPSSMPPLSIGPSLRNPEPRKVFQCPEPGCRSTAKSRPGLLAHMTMKHPPREPGGIYACHLCHHRTNTGFQLSRHLIRKHDHQRPAGHSRFSYVRCPDDGLYRLETTRLDSVEVAAELLGEQTVNKLIDDIDRGQARL